MIIKQTTIQAVQNVDEGEGWTYFQKLMAMSGTPYYKIGFVDWEHPKAFKDSVESASFQFTNSTIALIDFHKMLFSKQSRKLVTDILIQLSQGRNKVFILLNEDTAICSEEMVFINNFFSNIYK